MACLDRTCNRRPTEVIVATHRRATSDSYMYEVCKDHLDEIVDQVRKGGSIYRVLVFHKGASMPHTTYEWSLE